MHVHVSTIVRTLTLIVVFYFQDWTQHLPWMTKVPSVFSLPNESSHSQRNSPPVKKWIWHRCFNGKCIGLKIPFMTILNISLLISIDITQVNQRIWSMNLIHFEMKRKVCILHSKFLFLESAGPGPNSIFSY